MAEVKRFDIDNGITVCQGCHKKSIKENLKWR